MLVGDIDFIVADQWPRKLPRRITVGFHGTNRAGFEDRVSSPCHARSRRYGSARRYTVRCENRLDDRFSYAFTVTGD